MNDVHVSGIKIDVVAYRHPGSDIARIIRLYSFVILRNSPSIISRTLTNCCRKRTVFERFSPTINRRSVSVGTIVVT